MTRILLLAFLAAPLAVAPLAASAQTAATPTEPALARTAAVFTDDLSGLARLATAAALVRERSGAYPATPFDLLGSPEAAATGATAFPLSALDVTATGDSLALRYVPLPVAPYVREDLVVTATVRRTADGRTQVRHEMRRFADAEAGGGRLLYDRAGDVRVERGYGSLFVDTAAAQRAIAAGAFVPRDVFTTSLGDLTVRVHPPGEATPVYFEGTAAGASTP
ncbi:MAG TPA: hypothetical protein VGB53_12205 [Rubricoccaceae bacterium]|jgi:hypothetical protein